MTDFDEAFDNALDAIGSHVVDLEPNVLTSIRDHFEGIAEAAAADNIDVAVMATGIVDLCDAERAAQSGEPIPANSPVVTYQPPTCPGCGTDHAAFMVVDDVWTAAGLDDGWWCVACLEQRIGRALTPDDLEPCPMNIPYFMASDSDDQRQLAPKLDAVKQWTVEDWRRAHHRD